MTIATLLSRVQLRWTWEPSPRAGERARVSTSTSHTAMAARERKARKANRRRIRGSPRVMSISTVIVCFVEYGDTSRKTVGFAKERDTKTTMFLKMDRQHHAQHISRHPLHQPAHFTRRHRRTVRSSTAVVRRTKTAGYSEWKVKRVRSRIILLVQMNFLTSAEMARE